MGKHWTLSPKAKENIRQAVIGRKHSARSRKLRSKKMKGQFNPMYKKVPWNKGKKVPQISGEKHFMYKKHHSKKSRQKMRQAHLGKPGCTKKRNGDFKRKEKHPCWKGGKYTTKQGYVLILKPNHPRSNKDGYVLEHRLIVEQSIERYLKKSELVHHRNGIKNDNRLENLEILLRKAHYGKVICPFCDKEFLIK